MINCIILAGGNSRRMTFPKEFIEIDEKYMVHNSIGVLKNIFDDIIVVSNNKEHYKDLDVRVVRDIFYKKGPLAGLHSGLCYSESDFSFLTACDMPNVNEDFIRFLISKLDENLDGVLCASKENKLLPMNAIYKNTLKRNLREELLKGNRKVVKFIEDNNFKTIPYENWKEFDKQNIFENLNTISELEKFKAEKGLKKFD